jgi:hypothetical protein
MTELILNPETQQVTVEDADPTISVLWDQAVQKAVINTAAGPTVASRAYGILHTAIFDAWAAYEPKAISTRLGDILQRPDPEITDAHKQEAMSYAAYRVLVDLFPTEVAIFAHLMKRLGYDPNNCTSDLTTPAGIGNVSARVLLKYRHQDGSNQLGDDLRGIFGVPYSDITGYKPQNCPDNFVDIGRWTPEHIPIDDPQGKIQQFLTPQWGNVISFAKVNCQELLPPPPEPFLLVDGSVNLKDKTIALEDGSIVKIDRSSIGTIINPDFIEQAEEIVNYSAHLTDEQKLIAEFWEDGGGSSFPPGTWMTFGQFVSARDNHTLDEDAKLFFTLGNALCDAGIATWNSKVVYDYTRPVQAIRQLGELGLIGEYNRDLGGYAIEAWQPGKGTQTILAKDFITYQMPGDHPSPPFAEYTSGHSAFSAAGAKILRSFTGSDDFGASVSFPPSSSRFEPGITPSETITLEWDTFSVAVEEADISRRYGGIHFSDGDIYGRILGTQVADAVISEAQFYINEEALS